MSRNLLVSESPRFTRALITNCGKMCDVADANSGVVAWALSCFRGLSRSSDRIRMVLSTPAEKLSAAYDHRSKLLGWACN